MDKDKIKELIKIGVKNGQYPQYLYKYRISDIARNPYFDSIITTNSMMFSSPNSFNDPFDCQLEPDTFPSFIEITQFFTRMLPHIGTNEISKMAKVAINDPLAFAKILEESIKFDNVGVLCLSQEPDNILLWSHYADNHCGVCLKFDILQDLDFFSTPLKVIYDDIYPVYNHMTQELEIIKKMIQTKFKLWKYEKEIRIFKMEKKLYNFNKSALTEIIFGCNTPQLEIDRIKNLAIANGYGHLKYHKAKKQNRVYGLALNPV
jgi:Protein of unknown function (DUF2971)